MLLCVCRVPKSEDRYEQFSVTQGSFEFYLATAVWSNVALLRLVLHSTFLPSLSSTYRHRQTLQQRPTPHLRLSKVCSQPTGNPTIEWTMRYLEIRLKV